MIYKDNSGEWRWSLVAKNHGARLVAELAADAPVWNGTDQRWE